MATTRRRSTAGTRIQARLLADLAACCGVPLVPGNTMACVLQTEDLDAEVQVRLRPRVTHDQTTEYLRAVLEMLEREPHLAGRCRERTGRRDTYFGDQRGTCRANITTAIVLRGEASPSFRFVCSNHARVGALLARSGAQLLATFPLPRARLVAMRQRHERKTTARAADLCYVCKHLRAAHTPGFECDICVCIASSTPWCRQFIKTPDPSTPKDPVVTALKADGSPAAQAVLADYLSDHPEAKT